MRQRARRGCRADAGRVGVWRVFSGVRAVPFLLAGAAQSSVLLQLRLADSKRDVNVTSANNGGAGVGGVMVTSIKDGVVTCQLWRTHAVAAAATGAARVPSTLHPTATAAAVASLLPSGDAKLAAAPPTSRVPLPPLALLHRNAPRRARRRSLASCSES